MSRVLQAYKKATITQIPADCNQSMQKRSFRMHKILNFEAEGIQQQKTTLDVG